MIIESLILILENNVHLLKGYFFLSKLVIKTVKIRINLRDSVVG
jgi:hypothetical protein